VNMATLGDGTLLMSHPYAKEARFADSSRI
jgi:hypothetical protein